MDADVVVDDEFQTSKTHTLIRNGLEVKGKLRVADVHHDLDGDLRQSAAHNLFRLDLKKAFVDIARIAFSAGNRNLVAFHQAFSGITAANDSRDTEFTSDDGGMAGTSAAIRHDSAGALHHRFPVGIRHVRYKNVALKDTIHF